MSVEEIAGVQINVECEGQGSPTIVFVHGFACDRGDWSAQVQTLSARHRVVVFDLPGHGGTAVPETASVASLAETVCEIKARYGGDRVVLVGHSLGCRLALEAFRQAPAGVVGLVLVDGSRMATDDLEKSVHDMKQALGAVGLDSFVKSTFEAMFALSEDEALRHHAMSRLGLLDAAFAETLMESVTRWDAVEVEPILASVNVPVLILQSTHIDQTYQWRRLEVGMTNPWTELVTERVPEAELQVAPGVGHFIQVEAAALVSEAIGRFTERLSRLQ